MVATQSHPTAPVFSDRASDLDAPALPSSVAVERSSSDFRASVSVCPNRKPVRAVLGDAALDKMVSADLRDEAGTGPQFDVLRRKENRLRWLRALVEIRSAIGAQNAYDNAALLSHPGRTTDGRPSKAYVEAKNEVGERKRARATVMAKVNARIAEARELIGSDPLTVSTLGGLALVLAEIELKLRDGQTEDARGKLDWIMQQITDAA
ncbi:hypothetical protein [Nocardia sp. NPDC004860]|uniref:hypothetical protein n=1 Tax=Nocardia sp. NPDC004860 TaxID=3154557 RepID=UPI0033BEEBD4